MSIVIGSIGSNRLEIIRNSRHSRILWKIFSSTIRYLSIATILAIIAMVADRDNNKNIHILSLLFMFTTISIERLARSIWILEKIIHLLSLPSKESDAFTPKSSTPNPD
jgi:hypothetical protein